ncbi:MAG: AraC family transcriptional regulator [Chitinophagaceae bacterium]|nr:AraC family transcriptional regulator [Chitinophagaceae bacterium]
MKLVIKNMVCPRCISAVEQILKENKLPSRYIRLGEVELIKDPGKKRLEKLSADLVSNGFELLDDQKMQLIEKVKTLLIEKVQQGNIEEHFSVSKYLGTQIFRDYSSVSKLFSEVEGITIEQFFILQKLEKVKEWIIYNELTLSRIAGSLGYSSTQHLSNQFKKLTGMTPTRFRQIGAAHRKALDAIH